MPDSLSDIEQDVLSGAVRLGLADIDVEAKQYHADERPRRLEFWRQLGLEHLRYGTVISQARSLDISMPVGCGIAALSMLPGGIRIAGIVFCAAHFPSGIESRWRYACQDCDPNSYSIDTAGHVDRRDVITMEGGPRL